MTAMSLLASEAPAATALFFTEDPARSPLWRSMETTYLRGLPVVFDDRVKVVLPPVTEDQTQVPVTADARTLGRVDELLIIADLNPFPLTLRLEPRHALAFVALRMKIEQGTAIHAAALVDGRWHVNGRYLDAAGGGCSVKPPGQARADLSAVGEMHGRVWPEGANGSRLRLRIVHPMDNGMIGNAPVYFIETVTVSNPAGEALATVQLSEAVAPDPTLTLLIDETRPSARLVIRARDNNGGDFRGAAERPAAAAAVRQGSL